MNRTQMTLELPRRTEMLDLIAIERQARAMQAEVMADLLRAAWRRVAGLLRRAPNGQTA